MNDKIAKRSRAPKKLITNMSDELRTMKGELQDTELSPPVSELDSLKAEVSLIKTDLIACRAETALLRVLVEQLQQAPATTYRQSPKQVLRWSAVRRSRELLKSGSSAEDVTTLIATEPEFQELFVGLSDTDKTAAVIGIVKIGAVQAGLRKV